MSKDAKIDLTSGHCLFGAVTLTKNANHDKYKYSGYGIWFNLVSYFLWTDGSPG